MGACSFFFPPHCKKKIATNVSLTHLSSLWFTRFVQTETFPWLFPALQKKLQQMSTSPISLQYGSLGLSRLKRFPGCCWICLDQQRPGMKLRICSRRNFDARCVKISSNGWIQSLRLGALNLCMPLCPHSLPLKKLSRKTFQQAIQVFIHLVSFSLYTWLTYIGRTVEAWLHPCPTFRELLYRLLGQESG
jgi:hypothetical protein